VLGLLALVGCTDPSATVDQLPRKAVSGTVTFDGQPLSEGKIQFEPVKGAQGKTTIAVGDIIDGKYSINATIGPVAGTYKVIISSQPLVKITPGESPGPVPKMPPEKIPSQFNSSSTLTKEVTNDPAQTIDFDLKSS
jgi:hypothetical protein